jgi:hypothetical protein
LRKVPFARNRSVSTYSETVGQLVFASNSLHAAFAAIFGFLLAEIAEYRWTGHDVGKAIWNALRSDDLQRSILLAVTRTRMEGRQRLFKSLIWAIQQAGNVSEYRNDAVHTPFVLVRGDGPWKLEPDNSAGQPSRVQKLNRVGHQKLFRYARGDLVQLTIYLEAIYERLIDRTTTPLPRRPTLRSTQLVQQTPPKSNNRQRRTAKRQPRPKS